jgi:hypothetical protein
VILRTLTAIAILGLILGLAGCSGGFGTMDRIMGSWQGAPLDAVIAQWGYPHQEQTIAGHKLYRWFYSKSVTMPASTTGTVTPIGNTAYVNMTTTGGGTFNGNCVRTLEVDERNFVIRWEWSGNNCPFADVLEYSKWQRRAD